MTLFDTAQRFIGLKETPGLVSTPMVLAMLRLDSNWATDDSVAWCSAFANFVCWISRAPRSKSLAARSWLAVGKVVSLEDARVGYDIVVLKHDIEDPGPEVTNLRGHVGFFAGREPGKVMVLGGNQHDSVNVSPFPAGLVLGIRRLR